MDLRAEILQEHSRARADRIAAWVGSDRKRFARLMDLFLRGDFLTAQRAAMAVGVCAAAHPPLVRPWLGKMVERMEEPGVHVAVRRCVVRILQTADIPAPLLGRVASVCFRYITDPESPIAVRAFSMTVVARIASREPELGRELRLVIEQQLPYASKGFRACAAHVLRGLEKAPAGLAGARPA